MSGEISNGVLITTNIATTKQKIGENHDEKKNHETITNHTNSHFSVL